MPSIIQKRRLRSVAYNKVTLLVMAILALLALRSVWVVYFKYKESLALRNTVQVEVNELSKREKELSSNIQRLGTEEGVESEIRSKFSVSKNNESLVVIVDDDNRLHNAKATTTSIWGKFLNLFR
jgi:cell division protein FtsB